MTIVVNSWAVVVIRKAEKTGLNRLLICDCISNIIHNSVVLLPFPPHHTSCAARLFLLNSLITFNRFVLIFLLSHLSAHPPVLLLFQLLLHLLLLVLLMTVPLHQTGASGSGSIPLYDGLQGDHRTWTAQHCS